MSHLELRSWFLEPIPYHSNRWTKVRVWGLPLSTASRKWWRSSSIHTRHSANHLQTRYGTQIRLHGPICKQYATALRMPDHAIRSFARGFPKKWKQLLLHPASPPRRSGRLAATDQPQLEHDHHSPREDGATNKKVHPPRAAAKRTSASAPRSSSASTPSISGRNTSKASRKPQKATKPSGTTRSSRRSKLPKASPKPAKTVRKPPRPALKSSATLVEPSQPDQPVKKTTTKRVAFADVKQSKPGVPRFTFASTPAKVHPADSWSEEQKDAFERQRNTIPADDPDYWAQIATGVEGKTAEDCQKLWETTWASPAAKKKNVGLAKPPQSPKVSTPEVVMHVRKAATRKRSRNTSKYRSGVRRLADTIARETSDDLLEPEIITPKVSGVSLIGGVGKVPVLGTDGTPGTEVRRKREKVNQDGELATPEILARGKAFGLQEADKYVSLFKRRLGTCLVPSLKKPEAENENKKNQVPKAKLFQTTLLPLPKFESDNESQNSEDSDIYF